MNAMPLTTETAMNVPATRSQISVFVCLSIGVSPVGLNHIAECFSRTLDKHWPKERAPVPQEFVVNLLVALGVPTEIAEADAGVSITFPKRR